MGADKQTDRDINAILNSMESASRSRSSVVSMWRSVQVGSSHTIGIGGGNKPQSSGELLSPGRCDSNQQVVAIAPSAIESVLNLLSRLVSGSDGGGMKSQGRITKSDRMRLEKERRMVQVPIPSSWDSSYA